MALSGAERQKRLRQRRKFQGAMTGHVGHDQLNTWILGDVKLQLEALAILRGKSQREILEDLILEAAEKAPDIAFRLAMVDALDRRRLLE